MAGVGYAVTSPDIAAVNARLAVLSSRFDDLTPVMQQAAAIAADASERAFEEERTPDGQLWPPLAKSTTDAKVGGRRRGSHPILQVTGRLAASLASQAFPKLMLFGTNLVQAALQQFGGYAGRGGSSTFVPARAYIGLGPRDLTAIEQAAARFLGS